MTTQQPGSIPCPDCGQPLALPIESVLAAQPILCAGCGLQLHVNRKDSKAALAALGRWWEETAPARTAARGVAEVRPPRTSPRRPRR